MVIQEVLSLLENASGPVVKLLQRSEHIKVLVLGFKKGMILKEHQTGVTTKLLVAEGQIAYKTTSETIVLKKFEDIDIPISVPHSVEALDDSICLLIQG